MSERRVRSQITATNHGFVADLALLMNALFALTVQR
jgi:hypothetical protein